MPDEKNKNGGIGDSQKHRLQEGLLENEPQKYRAIFEAFSDAIFIETFDGTIIDCNNACTKMYGFSRDELLQMQAGQLVPPESLSVINLLQEELLDLSENGKRIEIRATGKHKEGRMFPIDLTIDPLRLSGQDLFVVTIRDLTKARNSISARKRYENQLIQLQKLDNLGQMANSLANDFNNLLTGIMGYADLLQRELPSNGSAHIKARKIVEATRKAGEVIQQLISYNSHLPAGLKVAAPDMVVRDLVYRLRSFLDSGINLEVDIEEDLPKLAVDVSMIQLAIESIVRNSCESMTLGKGNLCIRVCQGKKSFNGAESGYFGPPMNTGEYIAISIKDDGCGISPHDSTKIFDPFFTTKYSRRGLGLSLVLGTVRAHRGAVLVDSTPGVGTELILMIPFGLQSGFVENEDWEQTNEKECLLGTVLVVDDEESVREILADQLAQLGYDSVLAMNGRQGLELFKAQNHNLLMAIIDLSMPEMNGLELLKEIRWLNPEIPVVICSGLVLDATRKQLELLRISGILEKPFSIKDIEKLFLQIQLGNGKNFATEST